MKPEHLHILQHSLGADQYGRGSQYRNRYVTDCDGPDGLICNELCGLGLMQDYGAQSIAGEMHYYSVTDAGKAAMLYSSPEPPKLSRSQKRYRAWLKADCGMTFGEWIKQNSGMPVTP